MKRKRRILSLLLCGAMLFSLCSQPALAEGNRQADGVTIGAGGLCEHHQEHNADCGYTEGTAGTPCGHEHTADCYEEVTNCVHEHDEDCYQEESDSDDEATPSNAQKREPENCPHICDEESGCITEKLNCQHEHDDECGYSPATAGTPCGYVCELCGAGDNTPSNAEAVTVASVQAMIDGLPNAEEITEDNAEEVKAQLEAIDEAKAQLSDEETDELDMTRYAEAAAALGALAAPMLLANDSPDEQFSLKPGDTYYFDLSGEDIPGTANSGNSDGAVSLPDTSLHYVPFTYVGTIEAYKLTSATATTEEYAQQNKYPHSLFVADYAVTHTISWDDLNTKSLIFGKDYVAGGVDYTLRAPSCGSWFTGSGDSECGTPQSNEWDAVLDKNSGYIQNWNKMYSWGQDTSSNELWYRAVRGYSSARYWNFYDAAFSGPRVGFRPVLEILNADTLGPDGLKVVTLDLGGGKLGGSSDAIHIIVKNGSKFTAPASGGLTRPAGDTGSYFMWLDSNGNSYAPGGSVPADVTKLTVQWTAPAYTVTLNAGNGTINSGNVTSYTYGVGATLPTDVTRTGYTFKGWYDNEGLTGDPVTAIGDTETGNKEYWAKWEINQYTVTVKPENGEADITITQDYGTPITAPTLTREGYQFNGWDKAFPTTMPAEDLTITAQWRDIAAPTGEIKIAENGWKSFFNTITFDLFFKDTQMVTVTAADNSGEAVTVEYLLSDKALTESELAGMTFTTYSAPFSINPDNEYVIYAKLTDTSGNVAYINTNGIVLDATVPVISGIEAGKTYCAAQTITVDEKYIGTVKVNSTKVILDENSQFALSPASGEQTIVVTDKAGNETRVTVTVNDGHTYEWQSENGQYWQKCKFCNHETAKKDIPTINISGADKVCRTQDYKFSFTLPEGATDAACGYEFIGLGGGPLTPTVENGLYSGIIKASTYPVTENSFKLIVSAKTADGFDFSAEKKVTIQNEHTGGTATCKDKAICEVCGESYGKLDPNNHANLKHIDAKAATKTSEGNIEYWYCDGCNKYYKDAKATQEITKAQTVTAKRPSGTIKPGADKSPQTGDNSNLLSWSALLFVSGGAAIGTTVVSRRKKYNR